MATPETTPLLTDATGIPISQHWNAAAGGGAGAYEADEGADGARKVRQENGHNVALGTTTDPMAGDDLATGAATLNSLARRIAYELQQIGQLNATVAADAAALSMSVAGVSDTLPDETALAGQAAGTYRVARFSGTVGGVVYEEADVLVLWDGAAVTDVLGGTIPSTQKGADKGIPIMVTSPTSADALTTTQAPTGAILHIAGESTPFRIEASGTADGVVTFAMSDGRVRRRQFSGPVFVDWHPGVVPDNDSPAAQAANTAAIQAVYDAGFPDIAFQGGAYHTDGTLTIPPTVMRHSMHREARIVYHGSGVAVVADHIEDAERIEITVERSAVAWHTGADATSVGIRLDACDDTEWHLSAKNFWWGIQPYGDAEGNVGNNIFLRRVRNNRVGFATLLENGAWFNSNNVYGGMVRIDTAYAAYNAGTRLVRLGSADNNNVFVGVTLEGDAPERGLECAGLSNAFLWCRWEQSVGQAIPGFIWFTATSESNYLMGGYGNFGPSSKPDGDGDDIIQDDSKRNIIVGNRGMVMLADNGTYGPGAAYTARGVQSSTNVAFEARDSAGKIRSQQRADGRLSFFRIAGYHAVDAPHPAFYVDRDGLYGGISTGTTAPAQLIAPYSGRIFELVGEMRVKNQSGDLVHTWQNLPTGTAPSVSKGHAWRTANASPVNVTTFTGNNGTVKHFYLQGNDGGNTTLVASASLRTPTGANLTIADGDIYLVIGDGTGKWIVR